MSFYNKFASIAIGGPNVNTIPTPYGVASLDVCGNCVFRNNVEVVGTLTYAGATIAYDNLDISGNLTIGANADISGNLTLDGSANLNILSASGPATLNSLIVLNDTSLNSLDVSNNTTLNTLTTSGQATLNSLRVLNDSSLNSLDVSNNTTLNTLTTSGQATLNRLRVLNDTSLNSLDVSNNTTLNTLTTTGQANLSSLSISGNLIANSDASFNAGLRVASDVSFNSSLYVTGNARAQNLKVGDNTTQLRLGYQTNIPIFSFYTTGTTSNIGNGNAFIPVKVIVPPVFPDSSVNMIVPINIYGSRSGGMNSGTWTLTYTSVTMNIYKNGVLQSATGNSITPVGFSGGTQKQATNSVTLSSGGYVGFYCGYFNCSFPVQAYSTNENIYDIELTISCSATHTSGFGIMVSVASVGGYMGYSAYNTPFTQDRVRNPVTITWTSSVPAYTPPEVSSTYINSYDSNVNISCDGDLMIVGNNNMNMLCNQSYRFDAPNGYWTGSSAGNFYLRSHSSDSQILLGNQITDWSSINSNSTQLTIDTYNKNYSLEAGTGTANTQANIITENANDYINIQSTNNTEITSTDGIIKITGNGAAGDTLQIIDTSGLGTQMSLYNNTYGLSFGVVSANAYIGNDSNTDLNISAAKDLHLGSASTGKIYTDSYVIPDYVYPVSNNSALGWDNTATISVLPITNSYISRGTFTIPTKGIWLIILNHKWETNAGNTVEAKECGVANVSGVTYDNMYYYEEINDAAGGASLRQSLHMSGIVETTGSTTMYMFARGQVGGGTNVDFIANLHWIKIA